MPVILVHTGSMHSEQSHWTLVNILFMLDVFSVKIFMTSLDEDSALEALNKGNYAKVYS